MATLGDQLRIALDLAAKEEELTPAPAKPRSSTALGRGVANLADYIAFGVNDKSVVPIQGLARTQAERPQELKDYEERIATEARKWSEAEGIGEKAGVVAKTAGAALSEPSQLGSFVAEQAPNAIPSIAAGAAGKALGRAAGRWAGAKLGGTVGAALGPVGAGVGAIIGMAGGGFLTDYLAEKASGVLKEVQDPTDPREVWRVINDKQIMNEKESEAFRHATGVTGVDFLTAIITRGVVGRGGIANALKGLGIETVGEGAGEAAGQLHAYGKIDPAEVALETIGGFAQSAGTTALFYEAKDPNLKEAQKTATDWSKIDPNRQSDQVKPDFSKIKNQQASNRIQGEEFYSPEIGEVAYQMRKARAAFDAGNLAPEEANVTAEYVKKLTGDYITSTKADPAKRQEAFDLLQESGFGPEATDAENLFKQRMAEEEAKKQAQEQAKLEKEKKKAEAKQQAEELKAKNEERKAQGKKPLKPKKAKKEAEPAPVVEEPVKTEEEVKQEVIETVFKKEEPVRTTTAAQREAGLKKAREEGRRDLPGTNMGELDSFGQPKETNIPIRTPEDIKRAAEKVQGTTKEVAGEVVQEPTITPKIDPESVYDSEDPVAIQDMLVNAGISPSNAPVLSGMRWMDLPQKVKDTLTQTYGTQAQREENLTQLDQQVQQQFDKDNPLPANAYGGTHGKGYKSRPTGTAITSLNKKYGGADKYTFREFEGKWYVIPKEGVVALDEKKKGPSAPKTAYADKIQVGQPFTPAGAGGTPLFAGRRENIRGTFNLTGQVMKTQEGNWVMENIKEDGTSEWISPNAFGETQEFIKKRLEPDRKTHKQLAKAEEIQKNIATMQEKKPHLANLSDENLNDILTEAKNISEIQNGEVRAKVIKKVTERLSTKLGGPVSMADIINIAAANREGFLAAQPTRGVAPQPVAEATPAPVPVQETAPVVEPAPQTPQSPIEETYPEPTPEEKAAQDEIAKGFTSLRDALLKSGLVKAPQSPVEAVTEATPTPTTPTPVETPTEAPVASPDQKYIDIATNEEAFKRNAKYEKGWAEKDEETNEVEEFADSYSFRDKNGDYQTIEVKSEEDTLDNRITAIKYFENEKARKQKSKQKTKTVTKESDESAPRTSKKKGVYLEDELEEDYDAASESGLDFSDNISTDMDADFNSNWNALPAREAWRPSNERKPVDIPAITNLANAIFDKIRQNVKDLDLVVYRTAEDLAKYPGLRDKLFNADGTGTSANEAQGYFIKKTSPSSNGKNIVVLNANKFISAKFTEMTILHEVVGHYGLRKLLGPRWESFVDKIIDTNPKAVLAAYKLIPRWRKLYLTEGNMYHGVPAFSNKAKEGYVAVKLEDNTTTYINKNFMSQMIDEYLAEEATKFVNKEYQDKQVKNFLQRAIAYVRHILRSIIGGKEAQSVTDEDIAGLLSESYIRTMGDPAQAMTAYEADMETQRFRQTKFAQNEFYASSLERVRDFTTTLLNKLPKEGRLQENQVRRFINAGGIKQADKDIAEIVLKNFKADKKTSFTPDEFMQAMEEMILPISINMQHVNQYNSYGLGSIGRRYENMDELFDQFDPTSTVDPNNITPETHVWTSPIETSPDVNHFRDPNYIGHTRTFREGNTYYVSEVQSDIVQKGKFSDVSQQEKALAEKNFFKLDNVISKIAKTVNNGALNHYIRANNINWNRADGETRSRIVRKTLEVSRRVALEVIKEQNVLAGLPEYFVEKHKALLDAILYPEAFKKWNDTLTLMAMEDGVDPAPNYDLFVKLTDIINDEQARLSGIMNTTKADPRFPQFKKTINSRLAREEIKKAAQEGMTSIRFPTGDTAAKIEMWPTTTEGVKPEYQKLYDIYNKELRSILTSEYNAQEVTDEKGHTWLEVSNLEQYADEPILVFSAPLDPPSPMSVDLLHDQWKAPQSQLAWLNQWREGVDHTFKKISRMKGMGWVLPHKIAGENYFKDLMYKTQGTIRRIEMTTRPAAKWLGKLAKEDPTTMGKITTTWLEGGDFNTIPGLSKMQVNSLEKTRNELEIAQQGLNALGYLDDFKYEASKGKYLHTVFISMANEFQGAGKTPSLMKYLEKRKTDPEAKAFLGINRNPEFAIPNTVGMVARDVALLQLMDGIKSVSEARNLGWVLDGGGQKINVRDVPGLNKKSVTYPNLLRYLDQTNELLKSSNIKSRGATAEDVATLEAARKALEQKVMEARSRFHASIKEQMIKSGHPYAELDAAGNVVRILQEPKDSEVDFFLKQNYVRVDGRKNPNLKPFHNKYVHKDIYNEFVNMQDMIEGEVGGAPVKQLWKDMTQQGGLLEKLTAIWKQTKTGLNIPVYYMRNAFGNWWLMDTTTDTPSHKLMGMLIDEAKQTISGEGKKVGGKTYKEWAEEYGLYATTFGSAELYVLRENFLDKIRIAEAKEEKKWIKYAGLQFKDTFLTLSEMTANFNGLLEGIFKQTSMRDYVERWEKRTGRNFNQLTAQEQSAVMSGAARQANDSIFDYQNVPAWLKQLRRIPLGTPFLTFNYYVAAHLPKAMLKHPWKMAKYYALPMMMMSAALELGFDDEEEEDYKKALESLPWYYRNNASHIVTPFKDKNGKYQVYDFTYMFPPAMFTNAYLKLANPSMGETTAGAMHDVLTKDLGLLGGPVPQAISAILSNKNPFNDRDISVPGDLTEKNIERWLTFFYTLAMPPVITETGFLGRTLDQAGIDLPMISTGQQLNKYGSDKETMAQTALRLTGVSPIGFSPQESQRANLAKYQYHLQNIQKARANALKDRNKSLEDRQQVAKEYAQKIRELNAEYRALRGE